MGAVCSVKQSEHDEGYFNVVIRKEESFDNLFLTSDEIYSRSPLMTVFKAIDKKTQMPVLAKQIQNAGQNENFLHEVTVLKNLNHPHVLQMLDFFETQQHFYIIYQYQPNKMILDYFDNQDKPMSFSVLRGFFHKILLTLNYIHGQDIFHGRLELSSIFFSKDYLAISSFDYARYLSNHDS